MKEIRDFIAKKHNKSFDEVFYNISTPAYYSQFNIMCTYLFYHKRDEYVWYLHDTHPPGVTEKWWRGVRPAPNPGEMSNKSVFDPYMFLPKPRIAAHARYHSLEKSNIVNTPGKLNAVLLRGYCDSPPFYSKTSVSSYLQHELCNNVIPYNMTAYNGYYNIEMHRFDYIEWDEIFNIILLLKVID